MQDLIPGVNPALVYDVGAHLGEDSDYYLALGYSVVAIEANPHLAAKLRKRFENQIAAGTFILIQSAIGQSQEELTFFVSKVDSFWGTTDPQWAARNKTLGADSERINVPSVRFADIIKTHGCPYYLKIDIEGADMLCLRDLALTASRPPYLSIESTKTSWSALVNEFDTLEALGYVRFKVINQKKHKPDQFLTKSGQRVHYEFENGASGPFGEHMVGKWLTRKQALARYLMIFALYTTIGDNRFLAKLLSRIPLLRHLLSLVSWYDTHAAQAVRGTNSPMD